MEIKAIDQVGIVNTVVGYNRNYVFDSVFQNINVVGKVILLFIRCIRKKNSLSFVPFAAFFGILGRPVAP